MKILFISDTHGLHHNVESVFKFKKADMIIHAGDVSNFGTKMQVIDFLDWFSNLNYKYKIFIAGNHDWFFSDSYLSDIQDFLDEKYPDIIYLFNNSVEIEGIKIWGSPYSLPFFNWAFNVPEEKLDFYFKLIPNDTDIIVSHTPPYGILDFAIRDQEHTGSKSLVKHINRVKPKINVFGHIHEDYGVVIEDGVTYVNASTLNHRYKITNKPIILSI